MKNEIPTCDLIDEEQRHLLTLEALAEIEAGEFVDHSIVQAWAQSLAAPSDRRPYGAKRARRNG